MILTIPVIENIMYYLKTHEYDKLIEAVPEFDIYEGCCEYRHDPINCPNEFISKYPMYYLEDIPYNHILKLSDNRRMYIFGDINMLAKDENTTSMVFIWFKNIMNIDESYKIEFMLDKKYNLTINCMTFAKFTNPLIYFNKYLNDCCYLSVINKINIYNSEDEIIEEMNYNPQDYYYAKMCNNDCEYTVKIDRLRCEEKYDIYKIDKSCMIDFHHNSKIYDMEDYCIEIRSSMIKKCYKLKE